MGAALRINRLGDSYMPIKLKGVLTRLGVTQEDWGKQIKQYNGRPLSLSAASLILNWNNWPTSTPKDSLQRQTENWLRSRGIPDEDIANIWQLDDGDEFRAQHPEGIHTGQIPGVRRLKIVEPDIKPVEVEMLSPQAKKHFKIFRDPFQDDVSGPEDVFLSSDQRYISEAMFQTAKNGGFVAIVGESGSGKTTLRKLLMERLRDQPIRVIFPQSLDKQRLNVRHICQAIINDLAPDQTVPGSPEAAARKVQKILLDSSRADNTHVLLIEEAHDLTIQTIKYLKRFYELEDGFRKLLSIILIGQPELKDKLDENRFPEAREVIRRIELAELAPLNSYLEDYLALKCKRVGMDHKALFADDAFDAIRDRLTKKRAGSREVYSQLYPLIVNNLVTKAMNRAAQIGVPQVTGDLVREF